MLWTRGSALARTSARLTVAALCVATLAAWLGAWNSTAGAATSGPVLSAKGGCGTLPIVAPKDPDHALAALGSQYKAPYSGFTSFPISKSAWQNWKPKHKSGWKVQI